MGKLWTTPNIEGGKCFFPKEKLCLLLHGTLFWICCCAHILNIIVQDGLSKLSSSVEKIKDIACNINSSQARYELYIKCCMELKTKKIYIYQCVS